MISVVLAGRNDDYGEGFRDRLFRACDHNASRLAAAGVDFEFVLGEWNPLPGRPLLSEEFVRRVPGARSVVTPPPVHEACNLNPAMSFDEMAAKNTALRRARGDWVVVTNADVLFGETVVARLAGGGLSRDRLYRARRIDVEGRLSWDEMQHPANHLLSGEGTTPPAWYLGAGGDFCAASRGLWHTLRGFNEIARFSTRAKDWQFYLSAAARGVPVEFVGDVFHLDHAAGFRNTPRSAAEAGTAHFGGPWDIEFGLPITNPHNWGLADLRESAHPGDSRIAVLDASTFSITPPFDRAGRLLAEWLTRPPAGVLESTLRLFHAVCAAHAGRRRLICRMEDPRLAAALAGFARVGSRHAVRVHSNWRWREIPGCCTWPFSPEPATPEEADWIATEQAGRLEIEDRRGRRVDCGPPPRGAVQVPFDPVVIRRLMRACLRLQELGARRIGLYGAGSHTGTLLSWGLPVSLEPVAILVSEPAADHAFGLPVVAVQDARSLDLDAVLLSSISFEPEMEARARASGLGRLLPLYGDWPADMWSPEETRSHEVLESIRR